MNQNFETRFPREESIQNKDIWQRSNLYLLRNRCSKKIVKMFCLLCSVPIMRIVA